ncbi:MAG TPA: ABC transporter permease [Solirubrobacteraceae bacterium]|nr:ABC transporter permease [Solirubrobacteraceae bacterium]
MGAYLVRRLFFAVVVVVLVSMGTFALLHAAPGGPGVLLSPDLTVEQREAVRANLGLDEPIYVQYGLWVSNLAQGDLGFSFVGGAPVRELITDRLPATLLLAFAALIVATVGGLVAGVLSATKPNSPRDHLLTAGAFIGVSIPPFWLGIVLIMIFAVQLQVLPASGMHGDGEGGVIDLLRHLVMPAVVLGLISTATIAQYTRSAMVSVLKEHYIRTARSQGHGPRTVLFRHALRNALLPVVTVLGTTTAALIGGAPVTETVFGWPGMGQLAVQSARLSDYPTVMGITIVISIIVVLVNLIVDILYQLIDPRVRLAGRS